MTCGATAYGDRSSERVHRAEAIPPVEKVEEGFLLARDTGVRRKTANETARAVAVIIAAPIDRRSGTTPAGAGIRIRARIAVIAGGSIVAVIALVGVLVARVIRADVCITAIPCRSAPATPAGADIAVGAVETVIAGIGIGCSPADPAGAHIIGGAAISVIAGSGVIGVIARVVALVTRVIGADIGVGAIPCRSAPATPAGAGIAIGAILTVVAWSCVIGMRADSSFAAIRGAGVAVIRAGSIIVRMCAAGGRIAVVIGADVRVIAGYGSPGAAPAVAGIIFRAGIPVTACVVGGGVITLVGRFITRVIGAGIGIIAIP